MQICLLVYRIQTTAVLPNFTDLQTIQSNDIKQMFTVKFNNTGNQIRRLS